MAIALAPAELAGILDFLRAAEQLKNTTRSGYTSAGRSESAAEHTWRLCLMVVVLEPYFPGVDFVRLIQMCIIHDLGEAIHGDVPAPLQDPVRAKSEGERQDFAQLVAPLPAAQQRALRALWEEYEAASTPEARLAKAFDKLETILQHTQGQNPADFDYRFNLGYGREYTAHDPLIVQLREVLDAETERRAVEADSER